MAIVDTTQDLPVTSTAENESGLGKRNGKRPPDARTSQAVSLRRSRIRRSFAVPLAEPRFVLGCACHREVLGGVNNCHEAVNVRFASVGPPYGSFRISGERRPPT